MEEDIRFMQFAIAQAKHGSSGEVPIGAVIVCNGRIIARAHNLTETLTDVTAHAEMQAITSAAKKSRRKISNGLHLIRNYRTLPNVCWCLGLEPDKKDSIWC